MRNIEVKIVQNQEEEIKPADISKNEEEMLLAKYGYANNNTDYNRQTINDKSNLTFEELVRLQEEEEREMYKKRHNNNQNTIDVYGTDSESGYTYKVEIRSDMPIPKSY